MPLLLDGHTYYWTTEACSQANISRNTFLRWVREGKFRDVELRDRRDWRLFTEDDLLRLKNESVKIKRIILPNWSSKD
jgi:excisionase family DNA binding protein